MGIGSSLSRFIIAAWRPLRPHRAHGRRGRRLLVARCCSWRSPTRRAFSCSCTCWCWWSASLVGLEIPLLMRIVKERYQFRDVVAHVLTFDYLGALWALRCCSRCCWCRSSDWCARRCSSESSTLAWRCGARVFSRSSCPRRSAAGGCAWRRSCAWHRACRQASASRRLAEDNIYADEIILSRDTPLSAHRPHPLEGRYAAVPELHLQFSSRDEYRYHEALVHPGLGCVAGAAAGAGARRRRRTGGARNPEVPAGREHHAGGSRPGDDAAVLHQSAC